MNGGDISAVWTRRTRPTAKRGRLRLRGDVPDRNMVRNNANAQIAGGGRHHMLHYAVVFFIIAIVAAILGFGGIAAGAAGIAKVLFFVFLVLAVITFLRRA
jgi:uncharacterized membrane protein YtjA (UPF0391 family)